MRDAERESRRKRGVAQALLLRLNSERLPRALQLKKQVDRGEPLSDYDKRYLKRVLGEASSIRHSVRDQPQYDQLITRMLDLYGEIMQKGAENANKPADHKGASNAADDELHKRS